MNTVLQMSGLIHCKSDRRFGPALGSHPCPSSGFWIFACAVQWQSSQTIEAVFCQPALFPEELRSYESWGLSVLRATGRSSGGCRGDLTPGGDASQGLVSERSS